jgi:hypothetical protein
MFHWLVAIGGISIAAMAFAAASGSLPTALGAGLLYAVAAFVATAQSNAPAADTRTAEDGWSEISIRNTTLLAITYAWGGGAILAAYFLTDLFWHHAWQYGGGMVLIALGLWALRLQLQRSDSVLRQRRWSHRLASLTALQAGAAAAGLAFLVASEKLWRHNPDWVANHVFVFGGTVIAVQSVLAVLAHRRATN